MHIRRLLVLRPLLIVLLLISGLLLAVRPAGAHPLGNFSINRYTRIEPTADAITLFTVVDLAEIPTVQARTAIDADADETLTDAEQAAYLRQFQSELISRLQLSVDGQALPLSLRDARMLFQPGQGGLETLRIELDLQAAVPAGSGPWQAEFRDDSFADRQGWRELIVRAGDGMQLLAASVPANDRSSALTVYPTELPNGMPADTEARFRFAPGGGSQAITTQPSAQPSANDQLSELIATAIASPLGLLIALLLALSLGAGHALTPGHGKTIVAAYLVGSRGTVGHAIFLGLTTTITHTAGVFGFGVITLFVSEYVLPEQLYPWLSAISGALIVVIGVALLRQRFVALRHSAALDHQHDLSDPTALHSHGFGMHRHAPITEEVSWRGLLGLGVSGGIVPCPSALILLLATLALGRPDLGLLLVLAFSLGLAGVLTLIGVVLVRARGLFERLPIDGRLTRALPLAGAAVVTLAGFGITLRALIGLLYT